MNAMKKRKLIQGKNTKYLVFFLFPLSGQFVPPVLPFGGQPGMFEEIKKFPRVSLY